MVDIFISYASEDRERVLVLVEALEADGFSVWWDRHIDGGTAFAMEIERALNSATVVVVVWSVSSVKSDWVLDEANTGKRNGKLIPIQLDATPPPLGFRQYQVVDFSKWKGDITAEEVLVLAKSIERFTHRDTRAEKGALLEPRPLAHHSSAVAVLPLENFSRDPDQQFFVDGMHEALITELSKIGALKVISRTSTRAYTDSRKPLREIAAELGVSSIVEGSVTRDGERVRITIQLIDARTDTHIWAESFDRELTNIISLQQEAARSIAQKIDVVLTPEEKSRLAGAPRVRPEAYESYLRGMFHWYKLTPEDVQKTLQHLDEALSVDPDYAPAHSGIAAAWGAIHQMGVFQPAFARQKVKDAVEKALELDPELAQAHFTYGAYYTWCTWDWQKAEPSFQRAVELNPNFPDAYAFYSHYLSIVGRFDEAETQIRRALDLDPFNPLMRALYGVDLMIWKRTDDALEQFQMVLQTAPDHWLAVEQLRVIYHRRGMFEEALDSTKSLYETLGNPSVAEALDSGYEVGGYKTAMVCAGDALAEQAETTFIQPTQIAIFYGMADEVDKAADWLEKAFYIRDPDLPYLKYAPRFSTAVMENPRVKDIVRRMNYPADT